jgi:radical SAM protein with 4Fe4S-binding SPASM domain
MENKLVAGWSFTSRCNLKCLHCYNASGRCRPDELSLEESIAVADKLKQSGVVAVNFGGGECCLRPDFIDLCRYLNKLELKISYTTNGTAFNLIENDLELFHDIGVSIDFADKKHDLFRGVSGTFEKAKAAISTLVEKGISNEIVTCITKLNCSESELGKIYELAKSLDVDYWRLNRFRSNGRGIENSSCLALTKAELKIAYSFLAKHMDSSVSAPEPLFRSAFGGSYSFEGDPSGVSAFRIQPNGEVSPSVFLSESGGNIKNKTLEDIFDSPIFRAVRNRQPVGKCKTCPSYFHCRGGDAGASYLQYGHFDGPDPLCWLEPEQDRPVPAKIVSDKWNVHERYLCTVYIPVKNAKAA